MKIARYWARGEHDAYFPDGRSEPIACWRWSETSQHDAQRRADEAAREAAQRLQAGSPLKSGYGYGDRPPREEILREIKDDGVTIATVTRNVYGALVLNTRDLMFIDVDTPHDPLLARLRRHVKRLFGRCEESPPSLLRQRLADTAAAETRYTVRLYETYAGFRCVVTNCPINPATPASEALLARFEADPLYTRLCRMQECFRVRLTPKFWRCHAPRPPCRYPWKDDRQQQQYRLWQTQYERQCQGYATCRLLGQYGDQSPAAQLQPLIALHDEITRVDAARQMGLPLA